jgi:hypothetical protein
MGGRTAFVNCADGSLGGTAFLIFFTRSDCIHDANYFGLFDGAFHDGNYR